MAPPAQRRRPAGNLPADLTTFVGRRAELTEVRQLAAGARLVTLTGFGGVGKTRLAIRTASELHRAFPGGVWLVELAALDNSVLLPDTVAKTVGLHGQNPASTLDAVIEHFSRQSAMLVLDNCEHLVDSCAKLLATLLRECPKLHVLATSREALGIPGEVIFPVPPLPVPPEGSAVAAEWDAITLFLDRARVAVPGFELTSRNQSAVFGICRGLGGIPLALELAAVRLRALSPAELFDRLADHLRLLTSGNRSALDRQRTLRGCIEWSYQLCTPAEQDLWARTSVFAGGFELDAAEAICSDPDGGLDRAAVVDGVLSLVDRSVLTRETRGDATWYWTLESLRQYGLEHLRDCGLSQLVLGRHQDYYFDLAIRSEAESVTKTQRASMDRLRREHANLRSAFEFSLGGAGRADVGLEAAGHLREHWIGIGALAEGRHWLERLLGAAGASPATRARGLRAAAWLATLQGDLAATESFLTELHALIDTGGAVDEVSVAFFHEASGNYAMYTGDPRRTIEECRLAVPVFEANGELANAIAAQVLLQMALSRAGDFTAALELHAICMETTELTGDAWFRSYSLWQAGLTHLQRGDAATAIESLQAGLRLKDRLIDAMGIALCLEGLAWATSGTDDWYRAAVLFGAATARWSEMGLRAADLPHTADSHVDCEAALRQAMSRHEFSTTVGSGMEMSTEDAVAFALDDGPATPSATVDPPATSPLTKREHEVALLVARGLSNKDIAGTLVISPRTAEAHVEHILVKLGFNSRAQIAAWVAAIPAVR
ncbi:MAG TPA: LuxR C-terminal-related transcriptional regulator [Pseudonocardiaceae bacterium]|jgi:predicted ATPase/DNA-binding CsgD family transcriptional regulator|nr:LuxR C-terminal-related transcriptional regulator [Pseudonocardiaceae bacterium]